MEEAVSPTKRNCCMFDPSQLPCGPSHTDPEPIPEPIPMPVTDPDADPDTDPDTDPDSDPLGLLQVLLLLLLLLLALLLLLLIILLLLLFISILLKLSLLRLLLLYVLPEEEEPANRAPALIAFCRRVSCLSAFTPILSGDCELIPFLTGETSELIPFLTGETSELIPFFVPVDPFVPLIALLRGEEGSWIPEPLLIPAPGPRSVATSSFALSMTHPLAACTAITWSC